MVGFVIDIFKTPCGQLLGTEILSLFQLKND